MPSPTLAASAADGLEARLGGDGRSRRLDQLAGGGGERPGALRFLRQVRGEEGPDFGLEVLFGGGE